MRHISLFPRLTSFLFAVGMILSGCQQEYVTELDLAVNNETILLEAEAGTVKVPVFSNKNWTASLTESSDWLTVTDASGEGSGTFTLEYTANPEFKRRAEVRICGGASDYEIYMTVEQKGELVEPTVKFRTNEEYFIAWETTASIEFESNVDTDLLQLEVSGEEWINDAVIQEDKVHFTVAANTTGAPREGTISIIYVDIDENVYRSTVDINQTAEEGNMSFDPSEISIDSFESEKTVLWNSNLGNYVSSVIAEVTYQGTQSDWISGISVTEAGVIFTVSANGQREDRVAVITLKLEERNLSASLTVTQVAYQQQLTFEELRDKLTSAGSVALEGDYIEAVAIADGGSLNMETDPMLSATTIDTERSQKINYVQSLDGEYGFRIEVSTKEDNILKKGDKVKISLSGATLVREDNPVRYTLTGLTSNSFGPDGKAELVLKAVSPKDLSDEDIYTYISLADMEIAMDYGSYCNINSAWLGTYQNVARRILRDSENNLINMLVNTNVEWSHTGESVPHGSGTVSGVIVHSTPSEIPFFESLGTYQIRPMQLDDIRISKDADSGFSKNIVVWNYPSGKEEWDPALTEGSAIAASYGTGVLANSANQAINQSNSYLDFGRSNNVKAIRYDVQWWGADNRPANTLTVTFSTKDVSGSNPVLVMSAMTGQMGQTNEKCQAPLNWNLYYSIGTEDRVLFNTVKVYPIPGSKFDGMMMNGGCTEIFSPIPEAIMGQEQVIITLEPADNWSINWNTLRYEEGCAATVANRFMIGSLAVKCNK